MIETKFKAGDEIYCNCDYSACGKSYKVLEIEREYIRVIQETTGMLGAFYPEDFKNLEYATKLHKVLE